MKYFMSLLVMIACGLSHAGQSDIVTLRVADDQELVKVHNALRFFYMVSKLEYDEADEFFRRLASSTCTNRLDSEQLFRIWTAAPDDKAGPGRIDITSGQQVVSLECPTLFAGLHRSLAPVYRRESISLYTHFCAQWLNADAAFKLASEHAQLIRQYIEPMSKEVYDTVDLKKIDQADVYAYNIQGSRGYLQKLIWLRRHTLNRAYDIYSSLQSNTQDGWHLADSFVEFLKDMPAWDAAIKEQDSATQAILLGSAVVRARQGKRIEMDISPEAYQVVHRFSQEDLSNIIFEFDLDPINPLDHYDIARIAPRMRKICVRGANGDNLFDFLEQYRWAALRYAEAWNAQGTVDMTRRDAFQKKYGLVLNYTYPTFASDKMSIVW